MRDYPKYIVEFHTEFDDEHMTPQQAAIEAMREVQRGELYARVYDVDTKRQWDAKFHDHVLHFFETRTVELEHELPGIAPWRALFSTAVQKDQDHGILGRRAD
jgi:hypothetical protein